MREIKKRWVIEIIDTAVFHQLKSLIVGFDYFSIFIFIFIRPALEQMVLELSRIKEKQNLKVNHLLVWFTIIIIIINKIVLNNRHSL